jgi:hypothetical protein
MSVIPAASAAPDLRRAGWGAITAAIALALIPLTVFGAPFVGIEYRAGAEAFDPVTNAQWTAGLLGLVEVVEAIGIAILVVNVRRALPDAPLRDLGALAGGLWVGALALHAASLMVQNTPAQAENWLSLNDDISVRAMIGAAVTVVQWSFFGVAVLAALAWTVTFVRAGRPVGIVGLGSAVPALILASLAAILAALGIIPPAATFAQIPLWLLIGIPLVRRARKVALSARY